MQGWNLVTTEIPSALALDRGGSLSGSGAPRDGGRISDSDSKSKYSELRKITSCFPRFTDRSVPPSPAMLSLIIQ